MRARAASWLLALVVAALTAGCGSGGPPPLAQPKGLDTGGVEWRQISRGLGPRLSTASNNACTRGSAACIDAVVAEMTRRYAALAAVCDHRAPFALMYLRVTEGVGEPRFRDPAYLRHLDALFARLYFDAFDNWHRGSVERVPPAWRISFEAAENREVSALGDMLLGMNAHISRDLPYALAEAGLEDSSGRSAKVDFDFVNELLAEVQGPMLAEQARLFDPTVAGFTSPLVGIYKSDLTSVIAGWRTEAWYNAARLEAARDPAERRAVSDTIERASAARARVLQTATSFAVVGGNTTDRDEHCKTRGAGA